MTLPADQRLRRFFRECERKYGLTEAGYRALYRAQGGRCYVCRKSSGKARMLAVDHDHLTGETRGLVCSGSLNAMTCNRLIAIFNRAQLLRAVEMLTNPPPARAVLAALARGVEPPSLVIPRFCQRCLRRADAYCLTDHLDETRGAGGMNDPGTVRTVMLGDDPSDGRYEHDE
jgi:hypothetical protein